MRTAAVFGAGPLNTYDTAALERVGVGWLVHAVGLCSSPPAHVEIVAPRQDTADGWRAALGEPDTAARLTPARAAQPGTAGVWWRAQPDEHWNVGKLVGLIAAGALEPLTAADREDGTLPRIFQRPVLDEMAEALWQTLVRNAEAPIARVCRWPPPYQWALCLTHDVDWTTKRLRHYADQLWRAARRGRVDRVLGQCAQFVAQCAGRNPYWQFDTIRAVEEAHDGRSTWLFLDEAEANDGSLWRQFTAGRYRISHTRIAGAVRALAAQGCDIGLHASRQSAADADAYAAGVAALGELAGRPARCVRQHYLAHGPRTPAAQHAAGLEVDSTLGFRWRSGWRLSTGLPLPLLHADGTSTGILELPMVAMDAGLPDEPAERMRQLTAATAAMGGACVVNWHHRHFLASDFPALAHAYPTMLADGVRTGAWLCSMAELADWWAFRQAARVAITVDADGVRTTGTAPVEGTVAVEIGGTVPAAVPEGSLTLHVPVGPTGIETHHPWP